MTDNRARDYDHRTGRGLKRPSDQRTGANGKAIVYRTSAVATYRTRMEVR